MITEMSVSVMFFLAVGHSVWNLLMFPHARCEDQLTASGHS
jgi:hypothetical protein